MNKYHETKWGRIYLGDTLEYMKSRKKGTVSLIMTSPPFGLVRKKDYGNIDADKYVEWFRPFAQQFRRILKDNGSLVIDIGGAWIRGQPTRSLYHYELLIMLCKEFEFHLAHEYFWWNPSRLPTPAEWVNIRRVRVKDAVNCIWWVSPTPWPKASNRRVLVPYSNSMQELLKNGYKAKLRPSGHDISTKFSVNNGAAIPPNLIAVANTESNSSYLQRCKAEGVKPHPARYPAEIPEYFIRMLTDKGDTVLDPFAGSCVTGEVADRLERRWVCCETVEDYLKGALFRFEASTTERSGKKKIGSYTVHHPASIWDELEEKSLPEDGGKKKPPKKEDK